MTALTSVILPACAGIFLGIIYFGGLWLTLRRLTAAKQPALLVLGSYLGRLSLCLTGFVIIAMSSGLQGILICTATFVVVRIFMLRRWGKPELPALTGTEESC